MRKFLFILASTATWAMMNPAVAQMYLPPAAGGGVFYPGYVFPGYVFPRYFGPGYVSPGYQDWRNNNWRTERTMEDRRQREYYEKLQGLVGTTTTNTGYVGECAIGMSEETCRRRGQSYNPPNNAGDATGGQKDNAVDAGYVGECAIGMSEETCRRRGQR
jgi:hypothetical protein